MASIRDRLKARQEQIAKLVANSVNKKPSNALTTFISSTSSSTTTITAAASSSLVQKLEDGKSFQDQLLVNSAAPIIVSRVVDRSTRTEGEPGKKRRRLIGEGKLEEGFILDEVAEEAFEAESFFATNDITEPSNKLNVEPHQQNIDTRVSAGSRKNALLEEKPAESAEESIEALLSVMSAKEKQTRKVTTEILDLLNKPTARELALIDQFKSDGSSMREFCPRGTKRECAKVSTDNRYCKRLHFRKIIQKHTDLTLGDCSFLNTCFHMDTCKYIHYEVDYGRRKTLDNSNKDKEISSLDSVKMEQSKKQMLPSQWIQCDLRLFDLSVLGAFSVVMADPPWDIHMELPYGTMSDDEMRRLNVQTLQTEGLIFLWVTGRAMELGRECLRLWGYTHCDEIIWVKTNQLQRIIRTGRTGHWLNHGKEHCLVGIKGSLDKFHRGLDCDVIVAEVRATSHKPDEIYGIIERLSPGTRKIELFGRQHNVQPNWITLGNQLDGVRLVEPEIVAKFRQKYPDGYCLPKPEEILTLKQRKPQSTRRGAGGRGARQRRF